jgi:alkylhydroperoxidase/carboxymuconolactone decarboxylase family protein YurZ
MEHIETPRMKRRWIECIWEQDPIRFDLLTEKGKSDDRAIILPRGLRELIYVAVDMQVAHLYPDGAEIHMVAALDAGVSVGGIIEVLEIAATTVYDSFRVALPTILEIYEVSPQSISVEDLELRDAYIELYGWWPDGLDLAFKFKPDLVRSLLRLVSLPDRSVTLDPKWRALILLALYSSPPLTDRVATEQYVRKCRELGASVEEVFEAVYCGASIGYHSFTRGYPALLAAQQRGRDRRYLGIL